MPDSSKNGTIEDQQDVTRALGEVAGGAPDAENRLFRLVYDELKRLAARAMKGQHPGHTLQPTALVHEAYLRLLGGKRSDWSDSSHFFSTAAKAMRSILVDHVRKQRAEKRGAGALKLTLSENLVGSAGLSDRILQVHEALDLLSKQDARKEQVVEMLFFGGLSVEQTARVLGISSRTVKRDWRYSRAWLFSVIRED